MRTTTFTLIIAAVTTGCALDQEAEPAIDVTTQSVTGVCGQTRTTIGPVLTTGELAATRNATGLYAAWTGTTSQPGAIVRLDSQYRVAARWDLGPVGPNLNGLFDNDLDVLAAYGTNAFGVVDMWRFTSDLGIANYDATYAGNPARQPFLATPDGSRRAYLWSFNNTLVASHLSEMGHAGGGSMFDRPGLITQLAGDNGVQSTVTDSAAVWIEEQSGVSRCFAASIGFENVTAPSLKAVRTVSSDCRRARIAAGPTNDIQLVVISTAAGAVQAHLRRNGGDIVRTLSSSGRAAKVRFDGTRFWIVWRDTGVANLRIASVDPVGTLVTYPSGPAVAADESFDLVRVSTTTVAIVALAPNALDIVTLCRS